ncbi:hypothetical protein [Colwellia ponticola]|uniref:Uncharacterized protein n=1 Tax=Colwellia ponticola TaxID=2304625 RepID=A0A8H2JMW4_9GAMM|nr:hypothetical protein [Colwellia ponticola]TMM45070.1 hypothetical protein FCS21_09880 [Colwellia ponticola]
MIIKEKNTNKALKSKGNVIHFRRNITTALITSSLLFACGGSSDDNGDNGVITPTSMNISGAASKGLILGANVNAYLINDDGTKADTPIGTTTTDNADGSYKLELGSDYNDKAFIIEITAADGSQMKCDLSVCLAGDDAEAEITFGELYTLPDNFKLSAA